MKKGNVIVGLDIGTTKICAIVGEVVSEGIDIIGFGSHPSNGLRKGVVVNIDSTVESIQRAVEEAELMSGCEIKSVYTGIAGSHIKSLNTHGIVAVKGGEVGLEDIKRSIEAAKAVSVPLDKKIIHTLPQHYIVDDQDGIRDPVGMSGVRLEAKVHIITGAVSSVENIIKSINRVGLDVDDIVLQQLASSEAVLSQDEKELGVALIDIGGGTTDIAVFAEGSIKHSAVISLGGLYVTNDIAVGLRTPVADAENIKIRHGCTYPSLISADETIDVPGVGGRNSRQVPRLLLGEIIQPRMEEILVLAQREIMRSGYDEYLAAGVVLTGGTTIMEGITELGEEIFNMPVRRGHPVGIGGLTDVVDSPKYATGVGLVLHGFNHPSASAFKRGEKNIFSRIAIKMKKWFQEIF